MAGRANPAGEALPRFPRLPARALAMVLALPLVLGGCVENIERNKVETALTDAGLDAEDARCMAQRMVDRLSTDQLRQLKVLKGHTDNPIAFALAVRRIKDPMVIKVTVKAAAVCLTGLDK